ncbi:MAG: HNH endonuclease [Planctomycetota bacterium]
MNRWNIPRWLEDEVIARDRQCVYCGITFDGKPTKRGQSPSWEHIVNDVSLIHSDNIARCCISCNASKGTRDLKSWLESSYCKAKNIHAGSVSAVIQRALNV